MHRTVLKEALHAPQFCRLRSAFPCQCHLALLITNEGTYSQFKMNPPVNFAKFNKARLLHVLQRAC